MSNDDINKRILELVQKPLTDTRWTSHVAEGSRINDGISIGKQGCSFFALVATISFFLALSLDLSSENFDLLRLMSIVLPILFTPLLVTPLLGFAWHARNLWELFKERKKHRACPDAQQWKESSEQCQREVAELYLLLEKMSLQQLQGLQTYSLTSKLAQKYIDSELEQRLSKDQEIVDIRRDKKIEEMFLPSRPRAIKI